jgi:hypothetical protein
MGLNLSFPCVKFTYYTAVNFQKIELGLGWQKVKMGETIHIADLTE